MIRVALLVVCLLALAASTNAYDYTLLTPHSSRLTKKPLLLAFYHPWYGTPWGPSKQWRKWDSFKFPDKYKPERVTEGWRHDIASADYPLIGPYDVSDPEVVRWHFRLAKAAGIDGFLCSWWKLPHADAFWDWQYHLFDKVWLPVAQEENFSIAVIDECAHYVRNYDHLVARATNFIPVYARSPAYLRINGQPVWFVYQVWDDWLKADAAKRYVSATESAVGDVFWIFDKMRAQGIAEWPKARLYVPDEWRAITNIDCFGSYSLYGNWRETNAAALAHLYGGFVTNVRSARHFVQLPLLPGHDNSAVNEAPYIVPRRAGDTLRAFFRAVDNSQPDIAVICSFNEWFEMTQIEPSLNWDDPYLYLKLIAAWRGKQFRPPPLPQQSIGPRIVPKLKELKHLR